MSVTAAQILLALRMKYANASVVREVTIPDRFELARDRLWRCQNPDWGDRKRAEYAERGEEVAESLPEGWSFLTAKFERRIDALIFGPEITAAEIKVSRSDFARDTLDKRRAWMEHVHRFVYVVPAGLVRPDEVGHGCGLIEFDVDVHNPTVYAHGLKTVKRAVRNKSPKPLPQSVTRAMAGRVSRYEQSAERAKATGVAA